VTGVELIEAIRAHVGGTQQARWVVEDFAGPGCATTEIDPKVVAEVLTLASEVAAGKPLQYALGTWDFRSLTLAVDERALIPRPETEQVVEVALHEAQQLRAPIVAVDLGTGTGAIALAIATEIQGSEVHAVDQSAGALELAAANAQQLGAAVTLHHGSWWNALPETLLGRVNLLVSNPPYVTEEEYQHLDVQLSFEPREALVARVSSAGVDGLRDLEEIINGAEPFLANHAVLVFECAPQQCESLRELASKLGTAQVFSDLAGRHRGVLVRRNQ